MLNYIAQETWSKLGSNDEEVIDRVLDNLSMDVILNLESNFEVLHDKVQKIFREKFFNK